MKFASALLFGLAAADMSYKQMKRQAAPIDPAIKPITDIFTVTLGPMVEQLDSLIKAYTSGPGDDVLGQSDKIVAAVKSAIPTVEAVPKDKITVFTAPGLIDPVTSFSGLLATTISDLIAKKPVAVQNNLGGKVYTNLQKQAKGAQALADAIKSRMPATLGGITEELSGYITGNITLGIKAFADQANAGAGAGGAASSPSGSSTSASGSAGGAGAGMSLSPAGSSTSLSGSGAGAGMSSSGMSGMAGAGSAAGAGASSPMTTGAPGSGPAVFMGAGASFKPASIFGLVAIAAAAFAF